ncbi:hypothetical protein V2J09_003680 [Rumex salicifolius]
MGSMVIDDLSFSFLFVHDAMKERKRKKERGEGIAQQKEVNLRQLSEESREWERPGCRLMRWIRGEDNSGRAGESARRRILPEKQRNRGAKPGGSVTHFGVRKENQLSSRVRLPKPFSEESGGWGSARKSCEKFQGVVGKGDGLDVKVCRVKRQNNGLGEKVWPCPQSDGRETPRSSRKTRLLSRTEESGRRVEVGEMDRRAR